MPIDPGTIPRVTRRTAWIWLLLGVLHVLPFANRAAIIGGDEPHYALMAHSIAVDGDFDLRDDYAAVDGGANYAGRRKAGEVLDRHLRVVNGREVFSHPLGLPLLGAPLLVLQRLMVKSAAPDLPLLLLTLTLTFAAALTGWRLLAGLLGDTRAAAAVAAFAYFGSPLWFYGRTFFTEPYSWSLAIFAISAIARGRLLIAALLLGVMLGLKETSLLLVLPIVGVTLYRRGWRAAAILAIGPAVYALLFAWKNYTLVGTPFSTFQAYSVGDPVAGAFGLVFDRSNGLFWYAPVLLIGAVGLMRRGRVPRDIRFAAAFAFLAYFVVTAAWPDWRGGSGYATRLLLPVLPALAVGLANLYASSPGFRRVLPALFIVSFIPHAAAAANPFTAFWGIDVFALLAKNPVVVPVAVAVAWLLVRLIARTADAEL